MLPTSHPEDSRRRLWTGTSQILCNLNFKKATFEKGKKNLRTCLFKLRTKNVCHLGWQAEKAINKCLILEPIQIHQLATKLPCQDQVALSRPHHHALQPYLGMHQGWHLWSCLTVPAKRARKWWQKYIIRWWSVSLTSSTGKMSHVPQNNSMTGHMVVNQ